MPIEPKPGEAGYEDFNEGIPGEEPTGDVAPPDTGEGGTEEGKSPDEGTPQGEDQQTTGTVSKDQYDQLQSRYEYLKSAVGREANLRGKATKEAAELRAVATHLFQKFQEVAGENQQNMAPETVEITEDILREAADSGFMPLYEKMKAGTAQDLRSSVQQVVQQELGRFRTAEKAQLLEATQIANAIRRIDPDFQQYVNEFAEFVGGDFSRLPIQAQAYLAFQGARLMKGQKQILEKGRAQGRKESADAFHAGHQGHGGGAQAKQQPKAKITKEGANLFKDMKQRGLVDKDMTIEQFLSIDTEV